MARQAAVKQPSLLQLLATPRKCPEFHFNAAGRRRYSLFTHTTALFLHGSDKSTHSKEFNMSALRSLAKLESMESRLLLSFASLNSYGILSVVGTGGNDSITVQFSGTKVQAILNGQTKSFNKSDVKGIFAEGFGGNDRISNKTSLPSTLLGDAGNDTFVGGSANDEIDAGSGNDHFDGGLGMNAIHEGDGNDAFDYSSTAGGHFNLIYPYSGVLPFDGLD